MRRPATALISVALAATLLAGCSSGSDADASPTTDTSTEDTTSTSNPDDLAALESVTVEGALDATPTLTFDQPFSITAAAAVVESEGEGEEITSTSLVMIDYVAVDGDDGTVLGSTWDDGGANVLSMSDTGIIPALIEALVGHNVGTRIVFGVPGTAAVEATDATEAIEATPATVMAIVATSLVANRAEGEAVEPAAGLPLVTLAEDGTPSIEVPEGTEEPTELVTQVLIKGAGAEIEAGQTVTFQYSGWLFDGTVFDSSWANGAPFETQIGTGQVITGWDEGLVGQTVGSQVLLVIPSELGYGESGSGDTIPPNSTLIFVVDILAAS
ncbi:FKBP-type peptidyl-prolyl cis-trans isomerase [Actinotalea sp.]|uniref:FKBP-type peptidyl-prolyl cis-trans isomerase n=1 Tax=Actinotalea sp. TaxID=1872145 RepID=UPI00356415A7